MDSRSPAIPNQNRLSFFLTEAFWLVLVIASSMKFCWGLEGSMDLRGYDELGMYMQPGRMIAENGLPDGAYAPLYQLWYFLLSFIAQDPLQLYWLNFKIMMFLIPGLVYVLIRVCKMPQAIAFLGAFCILNSHLPYTYPYCSHFATLFVLAGAIGGMLSSRPSTRIGLMSLGLLLASYSRPEFFLAFLLAVGYLVLRWLVKTFRHREIRAKDRIRPIPRFAPTIAIGVAAASLILFFGTPWSNPNSTNHQGHRGFFAFGQHYALNKVEAAGSNVNSWTVWRDFVETDFGDAESIRECLAANPSAFLWHVSRNIGNSFHVLKDVAKPNSSMVWIAIFVLTSLCFKNQWVPRTRSLNPELFVLVGVVFLATAPALVLIYPRDHYFLPLFAVGSVSLLGCVMRIWPSRRTTQVGAQNAWRKFSLPAFALITAIFFTPFRADELPSEITWERDNHLVKTVHLIRDLEFQEPARVIRLDAGLEWLVGIPMTPINPNAKSEPFLAFLESNDANLFIDDANLRNLEAFRTDNEYHEFVKDPNKFGFHGIDIADTTRRAYFKLGSVKRAQSTSVANANEHEIAR